MGQVVLSVTNTGSSRTSTMEISEPPPADLTPGVRCLVPPLRPARQAHTDYRLHATRRGRFLLGPPSVRISDPSRRYVPRKLRIAIPTETAAETAEADDAVPDPV